MEINFKKEYRVFYMLKDRLEIVNVHKANYVAVRGMIDPNEEIPCSTANIDISNLVDVSLTDSLTI